MCVCVCVCVCLCSCVLVVVHPILIFVGRQRVRIKFFWEVDDVILLISVIWRSLRGLVTKELNCNLEVTGYSQLGLQNTPTASLQRCKTLLMSVLDMTLNNLTMRLL